MCILANLYFPLDQNLNLPALTASRIKCVLTDDCKEIPFKDAKFPFSISPLLEVPVTSSTVLCEGDEVKTVIEIFLDISDFNFDYLPGDTIGILPKNSESEVNDILNRLGLRSSDTFKVEIEETKKKVLLGHIPHIITVKTLFESCLDLRAVVKKTFLRALAEYTSDSIEKRRITELCSREGAGEYNEYILKPKASILDVLEVFSSCRPPLSLLIEHIPRLQPRPYSIASSPLENRDKLRIVFNIVHDSRNRRGVCSGWLYDITRPVHDLSFKLSQVQLSNNVESNVVKVPIYFRKQTNFRVPESPLLPLMMIGIGTGIAPFVGFVEHRKRQMCSINENKFKNWVIFGCRHKNKDDIFRNMFQSKEETKICSYYVSYSRDKNNDHAKYVQDILRLEQDDIINQLLTTDTILFLCGNGLSMAKDIMELLVHLISSVRGISEEEAKGIVISLEKKGQIVKESWS